MESKLQKILMVLGLVIGFAICSSVPVDSQIGYRPKVLNDLRDVNAASPSNNDSLTWDSTTSMWVPEAIASSYVLNDLSDVNAGSPVDQDVLTWDNGTSKWINQAITTFTVGTANTIPKWNATPDDLTDSLLTDDGSAVSLTAGSGGFKLADGSTTDDAIIFGAGDDASMYWNGSQLEIDMDKAAGAFRVELYAASSGTWRFDAINNGNFFGGAMMNAANASFNFVELEVDNISNVNGSDELNILLIDFNEAGATHTGSGNILNAINIEALPVDEANLTEIGIRIGSGWESGIIFDDDLTDYITFEDGNGSFKNHSGANAYWSFPAPPGARPANATAAAGIIDANDEVIVWRFYLPLRLTVDTVHFTIGNSIVGANCGVGVYNADGTTLIIDASGQDCSGAATFSVDVTNATIGPGYYLMAFTTDDATVSVMSESFSGAWNTIVDDDHVQGGIAANASDGSGNLPSTTGAISADVENRMHVKLQG